MERDQEGFFYPRVDEQKCTDCGRCRKVCPSVNPKDMTNSPEPETYAVRSEDAVRRKAVPVEALHFWPGVYWTRAVLSVALL